MARRTGKEALHARIVPAKRKQDQVPPVLLVCPNCAEECESVNAEGNCPECQEHFDCEDALRDEEQRQLEEYEDCDLDDPRGG